MNTGNITAAVALLSPVRGDLGSAKLSGMGDGKSQVGA